jgi:hypothetical protein
VALYDSPYGSTSSDGSGRSGFWNQTPSGGNVVHSTDTGDASAPASDPFNGPGSIDFDVTDPQTAVDKASTESEGVAAGLKAALFGTDQPDADGHHGGLLGDLPGVGAGTRFVSEVAANVAAAPVGVISGGVDTVGGALERIPFGGDREKLQRQFDEIPDGSEEKNAALAAIEQDPAGSGPLSARDHYMATAIQKYNEAHNGEHNSPDLWNGSFRPAASLSELVTNMFGLLGAGARGTERLVAGAGRPGDNGMNQLQMIMAVGDGHAGFTQDSKGLTAIEQQVYDKYSSGEWSETQALDFMAAHGAGHSHDKRLEIAGSVALDPINVASLGAGALAKFGKAGGVLLAMQKEATAALDAERALGAGADAEKIAQLEYAVQETAKGIRSGSRGAESVASRDILGKIATQKWTGDIARKYGEFYTTALAHDSSLGRIAKAARTVIDPLHMWGGGDAKAEAAIEEGSREVTHAIVRSHGEFTHTDVMHHIGEVEGVGQDMLDQYENGLAVYAGNVLRRVTHRNYRAAQMLGGRGKNLPPVLDALKDAMSEVKQRTLKQLDEEAQRFIQRRWTPDDVDNLADRASILWGGRDKAEWIGELSNAKRWTAEKMSLIKSATYGSAISQLHQAVAAVRQAGDAGTWADRLGDVILINKQTLTDLGAEGIKTRLAEATDADAKLAIIETEMRKYPELANFTKDPTSASLTVQEFSDFIDRKMPHLPAQIRDEERAGLPSALAEFDAKTRGIFTLAIRPKAEFRWGLEKDSEGVLREFGDPWFDQVSEGLHGYSPVRELSYNVAGKPIIGQVAGKVTRVIDGIEAAGRTAGHGVTGAMVQEAARSKFIANVSKRYEKSGVSESQIAGVWKALMKHVDDSENISGARGLTADAIWKGVKAVIPAELERAGLNRREMLMHVLDAYDGDVRHIGLTQKFTGRAKLLAAKYTGANTLGVISEHVWPLLKFRYNPFFQLQEKIEPFVLNAQRGAAIAWGTKMSESDRALAGIYRNFVDKNIVNMADNDIAELGARMGWGKGMEAAANMEGGRVGFIRSKMQAMTEVQGVKQLNMLRTFKKGLGREFRAVWEDNLPGEWDKMLLHARTMAGTMIDEDEFAIRLAQENVAANNLLVRRMHDSLGNFGGWEAEFANAIKVGQWSAPAHLGELQPLDLDHMVERLALRDTAGEAIDTTQQMREALASGRVSMDTIQRGLRDFGAHPDYIQRVDSAFRFSHRTFWSDVERTFGLTPEERRNFETIFDTLAEKRGMTPVEYMSQVYSPNIVNGGRDAVGSLGALVEYTRNGRVERSADLAHLAGVEGTSTADDLYRQMATIMSAHLDPSAKRAFLLDMVNPETAAQLPGTVDPYRAAMRGDILTDLNEIEEMWNSGGTDALAQRIMAFVQGRPGAGAHAVVTNEASGVARIRNAATRWRAEAGRPRAIQRVVYEDNEALARDVAAAHDDMPVYDHVATSTDGKVTDVAGVARTAAEPIRTSTGSRLSYAPGNTHAITSSSFRPEWGTLVARLQNGYMDYAKETRSLYRYLTEDMGIKVTAVRSKKPYSSAEALRTDLARGQLRIPNAGHFHPILSPNDTFMARAVRDAFGHGQEANEFGSHDAIMSAAAMYTDNARPIMLADEFGRPAAERYSQRMIEQAPDLPTTVSEYEARWGNAASTPSQVSSPGASRWNSRSVGPGLRALPADVQSELITGLGNIRNEFPDVSFESIDVLPILDSGSTLDFNLENPTIVLSTEAGWHADPAIRAERRAARAQANADSMNAIHPNANPGAPMFASHTVLGDLYHEWGHVVDLHLHRTAAAHMEGEYASHALRELMTDFNASEAKKMLSEYAFNKSDGHMLENGDAFAELFDLAFNPEHDLEELADTELGEYVMDFRATLKQTGVWQPKGSTAAINPHAGMTVEQANAAGAGVRAEHRIGMLPQDLVDRLTEHFLGNGRYAESNPDVARLAGYMHEHMRTVVDHTMRDGTMSPYAHLLDEMSGMPVSDPVPYNFTEARLWNAATQAMAAKWEDAFRLQYFAQNRSMFQRSLNHPMFGLYPASYMWGKIGPELIKFIAKEPFGMNTGAMAYTIADMQKAVGVQRQWDPDFDKFIDQLGTNPALSFLGYMLPATPWSIPASYPSWLRDLAAQGQANNEAVAGGGLVQGDNFVSPLTAVVKKAFPLSTTLPWVGRALGAGGEALPWNQQDDAGPTVGSKDAAGNVIGAQAPQSEAPDLSAPTQANDLGGVLADPLRSLQSLFGGGG